MFRKYSTQIGEETLPLAGNAFKTQPKAVMEKSAGNPSNGGITAWMQVLGVHLLFFNSWGVDLSSVQTIEQLLILGAVI